jgi:hypothetical protein
VLAETPLGQTATHFKMPPQGPKRNELLDDFAKRNRDALIFWGAISALYAEGLKGEVHTWLPKGLTLGSIFWNDELPMLWKLKREGNITDLWFHVQDEKGDWSDKLSFDDLTIVDAYLADARGVNKGATELLEEKDKKLQGMLKPNSYQMTLGTPIRIALLREGFGRALERARQRIALKKSNSNVSNPI